MNKQIQIFLLALIILLTSCQVTKRRYQSGFYVTRLHQSKSTVVTTAKKKAERPKPLSVQSAQEIADPKTITAEINDNVIVAKDPKKEDLLIKLAPDSCDLLLFRDGSEIQAVVTEVGYSDVKYKRCDNLEGPTYVSRKSDLFMIRYKNGTKEIMKAEPEKVVAPSKPANKYKYNPNRTVPPGAIASMVMAIFSLVLPYAWLIFFAFAGGSFPVWLFVLMILLALTATVLGSYTMGQIKREPEVYKGIGFARTGTIIGAIALGIYLLIALALLFG